MSKDRNYDVEIELIELCHELKNDIRQRLTYFSASVYKNEMSESIIEKLTKLRMIVELFADISMLEPFMDYDAELENAAQFYNPGECLFTSRILRLMTNLDVQFESLNSRSKQNQALKTRVKKKKKEILAICQYGSRNWMFFQKI